MDVMELDVFLPEDRPKRLEQLRRKKGLDKGDVAKAIGVSNATYGRMESGGVDSITGKSLKALADLYNVSTDFILGLTDNPEPFYHDIGELGLSAEAVKHLLTDNVNPDVVNELLLNKNFRQATKSMAIYFSGQMDETYKIRNDLLSCTAEFLEDEVDINEITDVEEFQNDIKEIKSQKFTASRYEFDQIIHRIEAAVREIKKKSEEEIKANDLNRTSDLNRKVFNTFVEEYKGKSKKNLSTDEKIDIMMTATEKSLLEQGANEKMVKALRTPIRWFYKVVALFDKK